MIVTSATDARKNWSSVIDDVVREKPAFIKRTRDCIVLTNENVFADILEAYSFTATLYTEEDGSVTLSSNEMDLAENAPTEDEAKIALANSILDYANDFYENFNYWSKAPNRKSHTPYVLRALLLNDAEKIGECIVCRHGEN